MMTCMARPKNAARGYLLAPEGSHQPGHVPTVRQLAILRVIRRSVSERGIPPTMREIGEAVGLLSDSSVFYQLHQLVKLGYLVKPGPLAAVRARDGFTARERLAWLMYCYQQGYTSPEDRAILTNWMRDDPDQLTEDDITLREGLLGMADEILAALTVSA
jgi:hypothetical protein